MQSSETLGFWWLPDSPEYRVPGKFWLSEDGKSSLDVIQSLDKSAASPTPPQPGLHVPEYGLILGRLATGCLVTLKDCSRIYNLPNPNGGFPHSSYKAMVTIMGKHFGRVEDIGAERLILEYSHLPEWARGMSNPAEADDTVLEAKGNECEVRLRLPGKRGREFGRAAEITVEFPDERPLEVLVEAADRVQDLLTLGTRSPVRPLEVWWQSGSGDKFTASRIYYPWRRQEGTNETVSYYKMLFLLNHAPRGFSGIVESWMGCYDSLRPMLRLYFGMVYIPPGYLDQQVALLVNFLEGYHRRAKRFQHRRSLTKHDEMPLYARLEEILKAYPKSVAAVIGEEEDMQKFIKDAKDFRHFRAHFFRNKPIASPQELVELCMKLVRLIETCLLVEVGFEDSVVKELLANPVLKAHPLGC